MCIVNSGSNRPRLRAPTSQSLAVAAASMADFGSKMPDATPGLITLPIAANGWASLLLVGLLIGLLVGLIGVGGLAWRQHRRMRAGRDAAVANLALSEERLHDLSGIAEQWIWETGPDDRFSYLSALPPSMHDVDADQLLGRHRDAVICGGTEPDAWQSYREAVAGRLPYRHLPCRLVGRQEHHLRISAKPRFDPAGRFLGYRGVATETSIEVETEQRNAQARRQIIDVLRQTRDAAVQANRSKTHFLAAASHDLRQPLQALGLFVAILAERSLPADVRPIVGRIQAALDALEQLLDSLLDISRFDAGVVEAHCFVFPLQGLFNRLALEFVPLAEAKGLSMRFARTQTLVHSDPNLLERILRNLLSNAIRYTSQGGVVIGCRRRDAALHIEIWDSGAGIAPEHQEEIFQEFHQLQGSSGPRQGLGLGLAIVERVASLLDHRILLRSTVGKGSVFAIILPSGDHRTSCQAPSADGGGKAEGRLTKVMPQRKARRPRPSPTPAKP